jgi:hypothetical protein
MRRFLVLILAGAVSAAPSLSPAPELLARASGYARKGQPEVAVVHPENGIDAQEALAIAEWHILGAVDFKRLPVQSYHAPVRDQESWRVDVEIQSQDGMEVWPLYVDADTGASHGKNWSNVAGADVDLGVSSFRLDRRDGKLFILLRVKRFTQAGDFGAREECRRDAIRAVALVMKGFPGRFESVPDETIVPSEGRMFDAIPDRIWSIRIPLKEKRSNQAPL